MSINMVKPTAIQNKSRWVLSALTRSDGPQLWVASIKRFVLEKIGKIPATTKEKLDGGT